MSENALLDKEKDTVLNGVNVTKFFEVIDIIKETPEVGKFVFRNKNEWITGGQNISSIDGFYGAMKEQKREQPFALVNDEPPVLLGSDKGASPVEQLLHGLAGCITATTIYHAASKGIKIDEMETKFEGDLDLQGFLGLSENIRNGFGKIRVSVKIKSDASQEQLEELVKLAERRSPVYDMVTNSVPVVVKLES